MQPPASSAAGSRVRTTSRATSGGLRPGPRRGPEAPLSYPKVAVENFDIKFVECAAVFAHTQRKVDAGKTGGGGRFLRPFGPPPAL